MNISPIDWIVIVAYAVFALAVGIRYSRRAGENVEQFFLSGRSLPWWMAGTSMVATTFASDTPLVITGWVRDAGIWKNWLWWCLAAGGMLTVFLFARYWRRGEVMTTAELAELRYGGREAKVLRGVLGFYQAAITNTIILCWVILAAAKIMDVLFEVDKSVAVTLACLLALAYSMLAGFWGVVVTDIVQFSMAMVGSVALAIYSWRAVGGAAGVIQAAATEGSGFTSETLALFPASGDPASETGWWTLSLATVCVFLGVQWWANDQVDGGSLAVQRISASRTERDGVLAALWYNVAHYALRPWPWILVALASIVVLPRIEVISPVAGMVTSTRGGIIEIQPDDARELITLDLEQFAAAPDWRPDRVLVKPLGTRDARPDDPGALVGDAYVQVGEVLARTDSERAYVVMMLRFLPVGLLGLAIASLLAAFMSTVDTHVNLASSFFINDIYSRFLCPGRRPGHYVTAARVTSAVVLALAGLLAWKAESISDLFTFFLAFLGGVGPVYLLRWIWWRVRAATEIVAMVSSSAAATWLTFGEQIGGWIRDWTGWAGPAYWASYRWHLGPLFHDGKLEPAGRLILVVAFSASLSLLSIALLPKPKPARLVEFYRKIRPIGWWGPVHELCPELGSRSAQGPEVKAVAIGSLGGLLMIYGMTFGIGGWLLDRHALAIGWLLAAYVGKECVSWALRQLAESPTDDGQGPAARVAHTEGHARKEP